MLKFILISLMTFSGLNAHAWYCYDVASERNGDVINACGIAESADEDLARKTALHNAYKELDLICSRSADCANKALEISPLRTECKKVENLYRCHRGVTATITTDERDMDQKKLLEEVFVPKKVVNYDKASTLNKSSIIDFNSEPEGASVHVDGVEICETPCKSEIEQGEHKIIFEKSGYDLYTTIQIIDDGSHSIQATLNDLYGYVDILHLPEDAKVKINNKEISSRRMIRLLPNEHVITVSSKYFQPWHKKFSIEKGQKLSFEFDAEPLYSFIKISAKDEDGVPIKVNVEVNGQSYGKTPALIKVPAGPKTITLSHHDYKTVEFTTVLDVNEEESFTKKLTSSYNKEWATYFGFGLHGKSLKKVEETEEYSCCMVFDFALQRRIYRVLHARLFYQYNSDTNGDAEVLNAGEGTPNTTVYAVSASAGHQLGVALPIYLYESDRHRFHIGPAAGVFQGRLEFDKLVYDNFGYGIIRSNIEEYSYKQSFQGILTGFEWVQADKNDVVVGWYLNAGAFQYTSLDKKTMRSSEGDQISIPNKGVIAGFFIGGLLLAF